MAQLFTRRATILLRATMAGALLAGAGAVGLGLWHVRSGSFWNVGRPADQPIPFRHDLHAGGLGLDCRYCHTAVERSPAAGMPAADTCLSCHSRIWQAASLLEPLRSSAALGQAIRWSSVHRLPSHAHFHHGVHVSAGVACSACHGAVENMPRTVKAVTLSMGWCLDCHRNAATPGLAGHSPPGPKLLVRKVGSEATPSDPVGAVPLLASCSTCHR